MGKLLFELTSATKPSESRPCSDESGLQMCELCERLGKPSRGLHVISECTVAYRGHEFGMVISWLVTDRRTHQACRLSSGQRSPLPAWGVCTTLSGCHSLAEGQ